MSEDEDPEVIADLQLRARTERDLTRTRTSPTWSTPVFVAEWPCRVCAELVPVTQDAIDRADQSDRWLVAKGDEKLDRNRIEICATCRSKRKALIGSRNHERNAKLAVLIREIREVDPHSRREAELVRDIIAAGHPDIEGMVQAIRDRKASSRPRRGV